MHPWSVCSTKTADSTMRATAAVAGTRKMTLTSRSSHSKNVGCAGDIVQILEREAGAAEHAPPNGNPQLWGYLSGESLDK